MTQYFYTDPLAAAWMSKHFGMKLTSSPSETEQPDEPRELSTAYMEEFESRGPYYIHPDSLLLLEMNEGDLCIFKGALGNEIVDFYNDYLLFKERAAGALLRIIQRDGKAFHWPESDAV